MKSIHYIYKVTNIINNHYYIGKHSTNNIDDGYFGSGFALRKAFKKYGKENFKKEIIKFCNSEDDAYKLESELVTIKEVKNKECYNLITGGSGAGAGENNYMYGKSHSQETKDKITEKLSYYAEKRKGVKRSNSVKKKISESKKGKKNYQFGKTGALSINSKSVYRINKLDNDIIDSFTSVLRRLNI